MKQEHIILMQGKKHSAKKTGRREKVVNFHGDAVNHQPYYSDKAKTMLLAAGKAISNVMGCRWVEAERNTHCVIM